LLNVNPQRFVNDVVKPWDELNALLVQRYAFQPDLSDVTRLAGALAVAIKHQADLAGCTDRSAIDAASLENKLMSDVGDFWKHGPLRESSRNNSLSVSAMFEYGPGRASGSCGTGSSSRMRRSMNMTSCIRPVRLFGIG
jgi:hypothetical protein